MWIPDDEKRFTSKFRWHEVAVYGNGRVYRLQDKNKEPIFYDVSAIDEVREKYSNTGLYLSAFARSSPSIESDNLLSNLYFDFDSPELGEARDDAVRVFEHLKEYFEHDESIRIYYSGAKGFHIECEALAIGISPSGNLPRVYRTIAQDLTDKYRLGTVDFQVYDPRRMWRLTNSIHQGSGLYKSPINTDLLYGDLGDIKKWANEPHEELLSEPVFEIKANEWFREYVYKTEQETTKKSISFDDLVRRFENGGSRVHKDDAEITFDPTCFDEAPEGPSCPSLARLWNKAETEGYLTHEERLFLCSLLTYNDEARYYLHSILSNLKDYSWEKSESHIQDWIKRREYGIGGRPYSCQRANEAGVGCMNCELDTRKKRVQTKNGWIEVEEDALPSPVRFCYKWH